MYRKALALFAVVAIVVAPAAHAEDRAAGTLCHLTSVVDAGGQGTGGVAGGPFAVANPNGGAVFDVTVGCTITPGICCEWVGGVWVCHPCPWDATRTATMAGNVGALFDTISYTALPGEDLFLCTYVSWNSTEGHTDLALPCEPLT